MRLTLISLLILTASVGCGKSFQSCTEVCTHHHANLDPESCSGYTNLAVDACIAKCQFYVDVAGEDCSEEVHAFLDDIGGRQLSCGWWEDCSGGYDDTCDGFASTPDIGECMRAHGESSDFPDDHPDWPCLANPNDHQYRSCAVRPNDDQSWFCPARPNDHQAWFCLAQPH